MPRNAFLPGIGVLAVVLVTPASAQLPKSLRPAEELVTALEAAGRSPVAAQEFEQQFGADLELATIDAHLASVREHLAHAPDDIEALILSVRLGRLRDGFAWQEGLMEAFDGDAAETDLPPSPSVDHYLAVLDGILGRDPNSAPTHYWKARLLVEGPLLELSNVGGWIPWPIRSGDETLWDPAESLEHARRAVTLDPTNTPYREFLAVQLALSERIPEAADVLRQASGNTEGLLEMIEDLEALGVPPGATTHWALQQFLLRFAMMGAADSEDLSYIDNAEVRYRAWTVPMSVEDIEAFYQERWPGMRFFVSDGWEGAYTAALITTPDGRTPATDPAELEDGSLDDANGISLLVFPPEVLAELTQGMFGEESAATNGEPRVGILLMNLRRKP